MLVKTKFRFLFFVSILSAIIFTTCETPMGMGDPIDWIAPVLTLEPTPNPYYARPGSNLKGKVTDNVGVERVIFIDTETGKELFPVIRTGNNFSIALNFSEDKDGKKISGQIIAYDKAGNSGDTSIAFITMIVDTTPPVIERVEIYRTPSRTAGLEPYSELKKLEGTEIKADLSRTQNGWFQIRGYAKDEATRINKISLEFYDREKGINNLLLSLENESSTNNYPVWTVKEEDIIEAGQEKYKGNYAADYYDNNKRYYYRVVIRAQDIAGNLTKDIAVQVDEKGTLCLWANSDLPKGIPDPAIVGLTSGGETANVSKNQSIPIEFYDDDNLLWAYTGLIKLNAWNALTPVTTTTPNDRSKDNEKLLYLKQKLTNNANDINVNENYKLGAGTVTGEYTDLGTQGVVKDWSGKNITELIGGKNIDEKIEYLVTSNSDNDYGDYILFTITADNKKQNNIDSKDGEGPRVTNKSRWAGRAVKINLKDENAPLIVFDTINGCPEENTFPKSLDQGKYFYIRGYTLRENSTGSGSASTGNRVVKFRMAWIPYNITGTQDGNIKAVQEALTKEDALGNATFEGMPAGVQYWDFYDSVLGSIPSDKPTFQLTKWNYDIEGNLYTQQSFEKKLSVMWDKDNFRDDNNFTYNNIKENETKLFIFYAKDSIGHEVFRQLPVLGYKSTPDIKIYDFSLKPTSVVMPSGIPNPTADGNFNEQTGAPSTVYYNALNDYNKQPNVITAISDISNSINSDDLSEPFKVYPRETTLKYWVVTGTNIIPIQTLTLKDITFAAKVEDQVLIGPVYDPNVKTYSFCEWYPDVTRRTFLFEATDQLGNVASVQRTVAVTNAARLDSITTTEQSGTYGHGRKIEIKANFSGLIYVCDSAGNRISDQTKKPKLNIKYQEKDPNTGAVTTQYRAITCNDGTANGAPSNGFGLWSDNKTNYLTFNFDVPENAVGDLLTIHEGIGQGNFDRPITLDTGIHIWDFERKDSAFIPGYLSGTITMPNWTELNNKSLQKNKKIKLDGVHPKITSIGLDNSIKAPYTGTQDRYFKTGETIIIQLTADKPIRAYENSRLRYTIQPASGANGTYTYFKYLKPGPAGTNSLYYSLKVDKATSTDNPSCPLDGRLINVELVQDDSNPLNTGDSGIIDDYGNSVKKTTASDLLSASNSLNTITGNFYVKQKNPPAPKAKLRNVLFADITNTNYSGDVEIQIPNSDSTDWAAWEERKQWSKDGGVTWTSPDANNAKDSPLTGTIVGAGSYKVQARYVDRAGNEGDAAEKSIKINNTFPALTSVSAVEPNGWYTKGSLTFNLNFADNVTINSTQEADLSITLRNRNSTGDYITLTTDKLQNFKGTTITFKWNNINTSGKEMRDGLYISDVKLSGLKDDYGLSGPSGTATWNTGNPVNGITITTTPSYTCANLAAGIKVDAVAPAVTERLPLHNTTPSGNALIKIITLTFREPVMRGSGVITVRPKGNYAVPPVLDDTSYYLGYIDSSTGNESGSGDVPTKYTSSGANRTYVKSFLEIYNDIPSRTAAPTQATLRGYLVEGTSASNLSQQARAGLNTGPYVKTTQGLVSGYGYTGNYSGATPSNTTLTGANAPNPTNGFLVPDTATKWVLNYKYGIMENTSAVNNIRTALTYAKWRWQEIDVVTLTISSSGSTSVNITLNEPLLKGLEWEVYYPAGTFTDLAGNPVPASGATNTDPTAWTNSNYYFTTPGVQAPVIRVNRRSSDSRANNWSTASTAYSELSETINDWNSENKVITDSIGWDKTYFNNVHYRVESESPNATVTAKYYKGAANNDNRGAAKGNWTGSVQGANYLLATGYTDSNWAAAASNTPGTWVLPNIVRRSRNGTDQKYEVIDKNGITGTRTSTGTLQMYKSYNRDLKGEELGFPVDVPGTFPTVVDNSTNTVALRNSALSASVTAGSYTKGQGVLTFTALEANKSYIIGSAALNGATAKGVEGVFRTVVMLNYTTALGQDYLSAEGSNIKNGIPSIAGFPLRDAESVDGRYIKAFFKDDVANNNRKYFYWVSTEIVCEFDFIMSGGRGNVTNNNGGHMTAGEKNNYLIVGYGDLTYAHDMTRS